MTDVWRLLDNLKNVKLKQGDSIDPSPLNVSLIRSLTISPTHSRVTIFANATKVLAFIPKLGIEPDLITCINFLSVCAECTEYNDAEALLFEQNGNPSLMQQWGLTPDITICNASLTVCAKTGRLDKAREYLLSNTASNMQRRWPQATPPIKPNLITCTNFLSVCAECTEYNDAEALLFEHNGKPSLMQQWGLTPDITICNAYLIVCAKTGRFDKAVTLVGKQMPALGIKVNFVTYSLLAIVDINRFGGLIKKWTKEGVLLQHLGLHGTSLNLHAKDIFNIYDSKGTELAVPFEFAKALFNYHRNEKRTIYKA
ncbi:hypothetical protein [Parashewanella curva]|nr:hypothetical protein [Parashewanella curva]